MVSTSSLTLLLAALCHSPTSSLVEDHVDLVEVNHYFDEQGRHVFDQTIFYDWSADQCRYNVRAFRLLKSSGQMPSRDWTGGGYVSVWHDGNVLRKVRAATFRESWTQYDPELIERDYLPKDQRRELCKPGQLAAPAELAAGTSRTTTARIYPRQTPRQR